MSAAVALIAYAKTKNVGIRFGDGKVRLSGTHENVKQIAASFTQYRAVLLQWFEQGSCQDQPSPPAERQPARDYYAHHFCCATCIGAGQLRGLRCFAGLELWGNYLHLANTNHSGGGNGSA